MRQRDGLKALSVGIAVAAPFAAREWLAPRALGRMTLWTERKDDMEAPHDEAKTDGTSRKRVERSALAVTTESQTVEPRSRGPRPRQPLRAVNPWARGLGWFSVGLGATELFAPSQVAQLIGVADTAGSRMVLRALGARELAAGAGLLVPRRPGRWLWSRVAGDLIDLALLGGALGDRRTRADRTGAALVVVAGVTAVDIWASLRRQDAQDDDSAALARSSAPVTDVDPSVPVHAVVTIHRPAAEIYELWRDFQNLPRFMSHVRSVDVRDRTRSRWHVSVTGRDDLAWDAVVTDDRPNQLIAWRSVENAAFAHAGEVRFLTAPGDRGTEVHLKMNVLAPGGALGKAVGKLVHRLPEQIIAADLKRLKQLLETGEIVKSDASLHRGPHPARPLGDREHITS
jgi:uncharacterized membrane protein